MRLFTDSLDYAAQVFPAVDNWALVTSDTLGSASGLKTLVERLYSNRTFFLASEDSKGEWENVFLVEHVPFSQYDLLLELNGMDIPLPDRMILLAGSGEGFHGQKTRPWAADAGNIHLVAFFRPGCQVQNYHVGFPLLAAVSVVEAIDRIKMRSNRAWIKWINDIVIGRAKVAGFVAHVQTLEDIVKTAVVGIGLNVGKVPAVPPDPFVPEVTSLCAVASDPINCSQSVVLSYLLRQLGSNYRKLLSGQVSQILDVYRRRCLVVGRKVRILSDPVKGEPQEIASGRVLGIGDNLELFIEGVKEPVSRGRLILID